MYVHNPNYHLSVIIRDLGAGADFETAPDATCTLRVEAKSRKEGQGLKDQTEPTRQANYFDFINLSRHWLVF